MKQEMPCGTEDGITVCLKKQTNKQKPFNFNKLTEERRRVKNMKLQRGKKIGEAESATLHLIIRHVWSP